jgi:DNA processing protein
VGEQAAGARAMCVWLGTLASWRPGFIKSLVREYRTTAQVLRRPAAEIAGFAARRHGREDRARKRSDRPAGERAERASDAERFEAVLREGPAECLRRAERRPPGDLVVAWSDALYPDQLRDLPDPPLCLFVRGGADGATARARLSAIVDAPLVAVVGTRVPSPYGEEMARTIAGDLARAGLVVVSGLAMGIDAIAQTAAVEAAVPLSPATVAVLGCGADVVYPRRNARLYARVAGGGLVLSEFTWGVPARAWRFPARNRIMAALGRAVVLVEGTERSGARITAEFGAELGREVMCVPGEAGRRLSQAPNRLLRDGARVCESAADVLRAIAVDDPGPTAARGAARPASAPALVLDYGGAAVRDVLHELAAAALTIDQLAGRCGLPVAKVAAAVSDLEVEGLARRVDGGRYRLLRG